MSQRARTMTDRAVARCEVERDAVFTPPLRHELLDLRRHLDLGRPLPRALRRRLRGCVDAQLAADELQRRRVVEVVERSLRQDDVTLRVDVRADVKEDLLVVV